LSTAIVTDSTSDIPLDVLEKYNIFQIPVDLMIGNEIYLDGFDLSRDDFYIQLPSLKQLPTTAAPSAGRFLALYEKIFSQGFSEIISIHAASALSGIYNAARLASLEFSQKINVVDSQQLSLGLGFQVIAAAKAAQENLPFRTILKGIESIKKRVHVYALLDTFEYIQRSGRISWARARIGSILNIKPIIELKEGEVINRGLSRAREKGIKFLGDVLQGLGPLENLAVLHTNAARDGTIFIQQFAPDGIQNPLLMNVTTIIGTHVGPNGLGFAAVVK
jgi:DegV family protein with EDD domain